MDDIVVVGGGLAGLAAAAAASGAGARVTVLEARSELGGRAQTDRRDGFALLRGPHALYGGGPGARVLRELGVATAGRAPSPRHHRLLRGGRLVAPPYDVRGVRDLAALRVVAQIARERPARHAGRSAAEWMDTVATRGAAADLLTAYVRTAAYTSALDELPAEVAIDQAKRGLWPGVRYLDGGWQPLVGALAARARHAGAVIRCGARVEALLHAGGVLADGRELRARRVVLAGLGPPAADRLLATVGGATPVASPRPVEAACLDVALRRLPRGDQRFVMGVDEPLFLSELTRAARDCSPPGDAVVHVARYLQDGHERAERAGLESLLDLAQPGWRDEVVHARYLPRMTVVEHLGPRAPSHATGRPDVLLAGDWVGDEGWLADASLASGMRAGLAAAASLHGAAATVDRRRAAPARSGRPAGRAVSRALLPSRPQRVRLVFDEGARR